MAPEKLEELEKLEAAVTPGEWRHLMLRADVRDLFAALREAWRERDEARAALKPSGHDVKSCCCPDCCALREAREEVARLKELHEKTDLDRWGALVDSFRTQIDTVKEQLKQATEKAVGFQQAAEDWRYIAKQYQDARTQDLLKKET